jgi:putative isomerase
MRKKLLKLVFIILTCLPVTKGQTNSFIIKNLNYPFSYPGSYMCLSRFAAPGKPLIPLVIRRIAGTGIIDLFGVDLIKDGKIITDVQYIMRPEKYTLKSGNDSLEICFQSPEIIRFRSSNIGIRLTTKQPSQFMPISSKQARLVFVLYNSHKFILTSLNGEIAPGKEKPDENQSNYKIGLSWDFQAQKNGPAEIVLEEYISEWEPKTYDKKFEECMLESYESFNRLLHKLPAVPVEFSQGAKEAIYLNWSGIVEPRGFIDRDAILMSKNWMSFVWSWDHCFNAIAMSYFDPKLAWDQMMVVFDRQDKIGCLPDAINDKQFVWFATKVPIHGWAIKQMMRVKDVVSNNMLKEIYEPLSKWTNFYLNYRDDNRNGIPQQNSGNETADNATVFDMGVPVESPDLCAHLIYQMDVLAEIAGTLGKTNDSIIWKFKADNLQNLMIKQLWNGTNFVYKISESGQIVDKPLCFLPYMPIVISYRLPKEINDKLLFGIEKYLITPRGIASESPQSKLYQSDGYWRGPVWAPVVYLMITGIENAGRKELAKRIAYSFCKTVVENGFSENFNAITGEGNNDPAYTWTSSVYLTLLFEYLKQ